MNRTQTQILKLLQQMPGVGKTIAQDLWDLGYRSIEEFRSKNPEQMYERLCEHQGCHVDRCMLYVFRCIVYYAETPDDPDPELLK